MNASPQYTIDVLADQAPSVALAKPGRDTQATPVEEVFAEVRADDDFGVKQVQMFYSVNGGAEKTINLFGGAKALPEVTASHTIYLEELGLKPGDFVSYYAKATDNDGVAGGRRRRATSTSSRSGRSGRTTSRRSRWREAAAAAAAQASRSASSRGSSGRSSRRRSTSCATGPRWADKFRENNVFLTLRRRSCASRSRSSAAR